MKGFSTRARLGVLAIAVALVAVGGVAIAHAVIGGGGVITTCYSNAKGTWRPIDTDGTCKAGESVLQAYSKSGADAAFLAIGGTAADSAKLGGKLPSDYMQNGDTAGGGLGGTYPNPTVDQGSGSGLNADLLDGIDSTGFVQGRSGLDYRFADVIDISGSLLRRYVTPFGAIEVSCNATAKYFFRRDGAYAVGGPIIRVFDQVSGGTPDYYTVGIGGTGAVHNTTGVEHGTWAMANEDNKSVEVDVWARFVGVNSCEFITHWSYGTAAS